MAIPARYAKFLASLFGQLVLFSQISGGFSHVTLTQALTAFGVSMGVMAVPNAKASPFPGPRGGPGDVR